MPSLPARPGLRLCAGIALLAILPLAGLAATAASSFESAEELRAEAQEWLNRQIGLSTRIKALDLSGAIVVERMNEGWQIRLPPSRMRLTGDGGSLRIADAGLRLAARGDGLLDMSWDLPSAIAHHPPDALGKAGPGIRLGITKRTGKGTYDPRHGAFLAFDTLLEGLALALPNGAAAKIAQLGMRGESRPADHDRFDSTGSGQLSKLTLEAGPTKLRLAGLRLDAALDGLQLDAYADALAGDAAPLKIISFDAPLSDAAAVRLNLDGLSFGSGQQTLALNMGQATIALDGLRGARSALVLRLVLDNLQFSPLEGLVRGLLPHGLDIDLEMQGLPNDALAKLVANFSTIADTAGARYAAGLLLGDLWKLMQQGEVEARLDLQHWEADMLRLRGDARLNPRAEAVLGFEGTLRIEIERLPALIQQLRQNPQGQRLVQLLTLVQGLGIPADPAQPSGLRRYTVQVTGDGRLEVNGTDMMPLIAGTARQP